jgi:hypothetical protein
VLNESNQLTKIWDKLIVACNPHKTWMRIRLKNNQEVRILEKVSPSTAKIPKSTFNKRTNNQFPIKKFLTTNPKPT